ncbi:hypothetical protein [Sneathiella glossodoripedis]|uniref:hypothetical protein n=1 Tax=Sneathiella glossodoripedis TaxID=418853 RepID=UPI00047025C6|nr:hypothetical protein [Sneathiella glossodoripedis]
MTEQFLGACRRRLLELVPVNSKGVSAAAIERQAQKHLTVSEGVPLPPAQEGFPDCLAHVWDWFAELLPVMAGDWQRGHVPILDLAATIELLFGIKPHGWEVRLVLQMIGQFRKVCEPLNFNRTE